MRLDVGRRHSPTFMEGVRVMMDARDGDSPATLRPVVCAEIISEYEKLQKRVHALLVDQYKLEKEIERLKKRREDEK